MRSRLLLPKDVHVRKSVHILLGLSMLSLVCHASSFGDYDLSSSISLCTDIPLTTAQVYNATPGDSLENPAASIAAHRSTSFWVFRVAGLSLVSAVFDIFNHKSGPVKTFWILTLAQLHFDSWFDYYITVAVHEIVSECKRAIDQ